MPRFLDRKTVLFLGTLASIVAVCITMFAWFFVMAAFSYGVLSGLFAIAVILINAVPFLSLFVTPILVPANRNQPRKEQP